MGNMQYQKACEKYVVSIEKGEDVGSTLIAFCLEQGIQNASVSGIGAVQGLSCGYYALEEKQYHFTSYPDLLEAVSLTGNIMQKEGKPFLHLHGVFTDSSNTAFGGHIEKMTSGIVIEMIIEPLQSNIQRELNDDIGLFLLNCKNEF